MSSPSRTHVQARLTKTRGTPALTKFARFYFLLPVRLDLMEYADLSSDFVVDESGSRLLSESLVYSSASSRSVSTAPGGEDLSLSELSLTDPPQTQGYRRRPFSLLAQPLLPNTPRAGYESAIAEDEEDGEGLNETVMPEDTEKVKRLAERTREEKLQSDLFILKRLNTAFDVYKEALRETKSSTEVRATPVQRVSEFVTGGA